MGPLITAGPHLKYEILPGYNLQDFSDYKYTRYNLKLQLFFNICI